MAALFDPRGMTMYSMSLRFQIQHIELRASVVHMPELFDAVAQPLDPAITAACIVCIRRACQMSDAFAVQRP
ncbi:MAG: hypothetical protein GYB24_17385 [Rhodobacteraceae bacterium]|nr:hypothetical protein [Paracoccaceae bacterium]